MSRVVECAASARSACKKCKVKIAKDELRVGVVTTRDEVEMTSWHHPACAPKKRGGQMDPSDFAGYEDLKPEDRETIDKLCAGQLDTPSAKKAKVSADEPPADDPFLNASAPGFAEAYAKYCAMPIATLKEWLVANEQPRTGTKPVLVSMCVDGELRGALPPCPLCEHGKLKLTDGPKPGALLCSGHFSEEAGQWRACGYRTDVATVKRIPWRHADEGPRPKAEAPDPAADLDVSQFDGLDTAAAAELLATLAQAAGASMSDEPRTARIAAGTALNASRDEDGAPDPAKALTQLLAKYPPKRTSAIETGHPANATIVALFKEYADLLDKLGENVYGVKAMQKATTTLLQLPWEITAGKMLTAKATKVEGIGASTAAKVDEILAKGTFDKLEEMRARAAAL